MARRPLARLGAAGHGRLWVWRAAAAARITRYRSAPPRWPAGLELTIAALADIHACDPWMTPERIRSIVERTNGLGADMIVLLGDYVAGHRA